VAEGFGKVATVHAVLEYRHRVRFHHLLALFGDGLVPCRNLIAGRHRFEGRATERRKD
jgi:hypothetical protein